MFQTVDVSVHIQIIFESLACNYSSHNGVCCVAEKTAPRSTQQFACFCATMKRVWFSCCVALPFLILSSSLTVVVLGVEIFLNFLLKREETLSLWRLSSVTVHDSHTGCFQVMVLNYDIEGFIHVVAGVNLHTTKAFTFRSIYLIHTCGFYASFCVFCSFFFVFRQHII